MEPGDDSKPMLGDEFRRIRTQLGLGKNEMARVLGLACASTNGRKVISRWEKGDLEITGPARLAMRLLLQRQQMSAPITQLRKRDVGSAS